VSGLSEWAPCCCFGLVGVLLVSVGPRFPTSCVALCSRVPFLRVVERYAVTWSQLLAGFLAVLERDVERASVLVFFAMCPLAGLVTCFLPSQYTLPFVLCFFSAPNLALLFFPC